MNALPAEHGSDSIAPADTLLSLISRASAALEGARTLAETVQAMKLAQAAKELGRIIGAANEARADCLRVELLAQMRIAREYEAAQARGEVAKAGEQDERGKMSGPGTLYRYPRRAGSRPSPHGGLAKNGRCRRDVVLGAISQHWMKVARPPRQTSSGRSRPRIQVLHRQQRVVYPGALHRCRPRSLGRHRPGPGLVCPRERFCFFLLWA